MLFLLALLLLASGAGAATPLAEAADKPGKVIFRFEEGVGPIPFLVDSNGSKRIISRGTHEPPSPRITTGQRGFMLVSIGWPGYPRTAIDPERYKSLSDWSSSASDGRWRWDPVRVLEVDLPAQPSCNDWAWSKATRGKLKEMGYNLLRDFGALGIVLPAKVSQDCVKTAYAYLGCQLETSDMLCGLSFYSSQYTELSTVIHELGHTLGLDHSNSAPCSSGEALSYRGSCKHIEYGDRFDPMGSSFSASMIHPAYSKDLGWIRRGDDLQVVPPTGQTETLSLLPYGGLAGTRAVEVALPPDSALGESSPGKIYIERKTRSGIDDVLWGGSWSCSRLTPRDHLFLRFMPSAETSDKLGLQGGSYLLDMLPETSDVCDGGLAPGESWSDPTGRLSLTSDEGGLKITTPKIERGSLAIRSYSKKPYRGRSVNFAIRSSRWVDDLERSDITVRQGKCKINLWGSLPNESFRQTSVQLYRCRPGKVQIALRAGALFDEYLLASERRVSPVVRLLPLRR